MKKLLKYIHKLDSKTGELTKHNISLEERIQLIQDLNKFPGEQNLDERIFLANEEGRKFASKKSYDAELVKKSKDWITYWNLQKELCYTGLLIDEEFYITGDMYFYLNFCMISFKNGQVTCPEIRDSDLWFYRLIELAELQDKFTVTGKRRQWGYFQPISEPILLNKEWKTMGDAKVGDKVSTRKGEATIIDIFQQGIKDVYKLTLKDGRNIRAGDTHLWSVIDKAQNDYNLRTYSTKELIEKGLYRGNSKNMRFFIPDIHPVEFNEKDLKVDPYVMGILLAESSVVRKIRLTLEDEFISNKVIQKLENNFEYGYIQNNNYKDRKSKAFRKTIKLKGQTKGKKNPLYEAFKEYNINKNCYDKFIPKDFLFGSIKQRIELLQGLMDGNGYINKVGRDIQYTTVSKNLAKDVEYLCRSLGINCTISTFVLNNENHSTYYRVRLRMNTSDICPFSLPRKVKRFNSFKGKRHKYTAIINIEKLDYREESLCISIDSKEKLYLSTDFIPTHNTLKVIAKQVKRFIFEKKFSGKLIASDEKYVKSGWSEMVSFRDHIHKHTAWKRPVMGSKLDWTQGQLMQDGTIHGLESKIKGITTKNNPTAVVSGKTDEAFFDEAGISRHLLESIGFLKPALQDGNIIYGNMHIGGAAGSIKDAEDLRELFYNPGNHNMLGIPNVWDEEDKLVGIFVPAYYSYGNCKDKFGNSKIEEAKAILDELAEIEKKKSFRDYMIFRSQNPITTRDMFASREDNIYPVHIIQPYYDRLCEFYKPTKVEIYKGKNGLTHTFNTKYPLLEDFPVDKNSNKHSCVVIEEAPVPNPPFGLYYAGVDTITPIKTTSSISVQAIYIYKAAHQLNGEYSQDKIVAWYAGRAEDPYDSFKICRDLIQYYNARALIENNNRNFIEWMINEKQQRYMMKRSEVPIGKDLIMNSGVDRSDYGINVSRIKEYLSSLGVDYISEVIETKFDDEGKSYDIYGVERIPDKMLLQEMLAYTSRKNCDRHDAFNLALLAAKTSTSRGIIATDSRNSNQKDINYRRGLAESVFSKRNIIRNPFL